MTKAALPHLLALVVTCSGCAAREAVTGTTFSAQRMPARIDRHQTAFVAIYLPWAKGRPVLVLHRNGLDVTGAFAPWMLRWSRDRK